jgi:hypothetical protein
MVNQPVIKIVYRDGKLDMSLTSYAEYRVDPRLIKWDKNNYAISADGYHIHRDDFNVIRSASYTLNLKNPFFLFLVKLMLNTILFFYSKRALEEAMGAAKEAQGAAEFLIESSKGKIVY